MSIEKYIEDIYFFEVNTNSSNAFKISVISRVRSTSEIADIFSTHEMKYFWYLPKKGNFFFLFYPLRGGGVKLFSSHFSIILLG